MINNYESEVKSGIKVLFIADEVDETFNGLSSHLKFIACKRVLHKFHAYRGEDVIILGRWSDERKIDYQKEYRLVRQEWFWVCVTLAESNHLILGKMLDEGLRIK